MGIDSLTGRTEHADEHLNFGAEELGMATIPITNLMYNTCRGVSETVYKRNLNCANSHTNSNKDIC
jgi:hypothetical protein